MVSPIKAARAIRRSFKNDVYYAGLYQVEGVNHKVIGIKAVDHHLKIYTFTGRIIEVTDFDQFFDGNGEHIAM